MKTSRKRQKPTSAASEKSNTNTDLGCTRSKLPIKRARGQRLKKQNDGSLIGKDGHSLPTPKVQPLCEQLHVTDTGFREKPNNVPALELELGQTLQSAKFKLQLFPIDETTCKGLEKDGHNPYLELKLSHRKKISSVLKHLNSKWGNSGSAVGEPMLFPYSIHPENLAGHKGWTSKDTDIKAADVYAATGRPAIFRLRYGWFTSLQPQPIDRPLTSRFVDCSQSANLKKVSSMNLESKDGQNKTYEMVSQVDKPLSVNETSNAVVGGLRPLNRVAQSLDNSRIGEGLSLSSSLWADSLTNISVGGLLSEASLHAAAASPDAMPTGSNSCQIPFSSDSFDALIAAHIYSRPQDLQRSAHGTHSSILDAEETCHAFSFQKFGKGVPSSSKTDLSASSAGDVNSNSFKSPSSVEEKGQAGITEDHARQEPKSCTSPNTRGADNVVSSNLGIQDINWSDSMGPLESLLSSRQLISCDSISLGGLFANTNSLDLFRNCSPFANDTKTLESKIPSALGEIASKPSFWICLELGTDTSHSVLVWAMAELMRHPKIMKQVQQEVREIAKGKQNVTEDDLNKMHYLQSIIKETFRLHPPLPLLIPHESTDDVKIQGYDIPAKTRVFINSYAIGRDPDSWKEPNKFEPERFMNSSVDYRGQHFKFIPFGAGRRICPAMAFATYSYH